MKIGKSTADALYVHKAYEHVFPADALARAKARLPKGFDYVIVKRNKKTGEFSFIESLDWDTAHEPSVGTAIKVSIDGSIKITKAKEDPQIYHHKWEFVGPDYPGFDYEASKRRSATWKALPGARDKKHLTRIGTRSYWERHFAPHILEENPRMATRKTMTARERAMSTSVRKGIVPEVAAVPRFVNMLLENKVYDADKTKIMDFGCGKHRTHVERFHDKGYLVWGVDFHQSEEMNRAESAHGPFDIIYASNVFNVMNDEEMVVSALKQIKKALKRDGFFVLNYPPDPRYNPMTTKELEDVLKRVFTTVLDRNWINAKYAKYRFRFTMPAFICLPQ